MYWIFWTAELIFFQLTIYGREIDSDLPRWATEFNEMPRGIRRIFPAAHSIRRIISLLWAASIKRSAFISIHSFHHLSPYLRSALEAACAAYYKMYTRIHTFSVTHCHALSFFPRTSHVHGIPTRPLDIPERERDSCSQHMLPSVQCIQTALIRLGLTVAYCYCVTDVSIPTNVWSSCHP